MLKPDDLIPDENTSRAAEEILDAYRRWLTSGKTIGELYDELGLKVGSPEMTAWLAIFFNKSREACIQNDIEALDAIDSAMMFCLWLGSRIERMGKVDELA